MLRLPARSSHERSLRALGAGLESRPSDHPAAARAGPGPGRTVVRQTSQHLRSAQVNRAEAAVAGVGGKGQNAAKAAATLLKLHPGTACPVTVVQFLGGSTGEEIQRLLSRQGIEDITTCTNASTRQLVTLIDYAASSATPVVTELIAPSQPIEEAASQELLARISAPWMHEHSAERHAYALESCPASAHLQEAAPNFKCILLMGTWPPRGLQPGAEFAVDLRH